MIGLVGSHRTGKTTTAKQFAEELGFQFVETRTSDIFKKHGLDPKADYDFDKRLGIQMLILEETVKLYSAIGPDPAITDRTPIDMLAYMMADVQRQNVSPEQAEMLMGYYDACMTATNHFFSMLALIQPGIPVQDHPEKAPANLAYMYHINTLCRGLLMDSKLHVKAVRLASDVIDLDDRVIAVDNAYRRVLMEEVEALRARNDSAH